MIRGDAVGDRAATGGEKAVLADLASWARKELTGNILPYWERHGRDEAGEGFLGEIRSDNSPVPETDRSIVMVARHLWTFSAAATFLGESARLAVADEAYRYLTGRFFDRVNGGFYWSVTRDGRPSVTKKQIYGQAFAIYALAEYARVPFQNPVARAESIALAWACFELLEHHARDKDFGGYLEALSVDWTPTSDRTLSPVDIDCDKSMNTNLHVLEALTNLYRVRPTDEIRASIVSLLEVHGGRITQADGHLGLYFNADWSRLDRKVSFGHDIEASWLMEESIEALEGAMDPRNERSAYAIARTAIEALANSAYEEGLDPASRALEEEAESSAPAAKRNRHRIWWCQAESMVGFLAAWQRSGEGRFLEAAVGVRDYIDRHLVDRSGGEWFWGTDGSDRPVLSRPKGGNWKTGYHDGRACMELIRRAEQICT